jgi:hypothetical protein
MSLPSQDLLHDQLAVPTRSVTSQTTRWCIQPELALEEDPSKAALDYLQKKYLDLTPESLCGPPHKIAHPNRCFFVDATLWTAPALAPTAVVPTLPHTSNAECGFQQLELGDEEQPARYPVVQAIRSGISLDTETYTRGSYHTVPIVPGVCLTLRSQGKQNAAADC